MDARDLRDRPLADDLAAELGAPDTRLETLASLRWIRDAMDAARRHLAIRDVDRHGAETHSQL